LKKPAAAVIGKVYFIPWTVYYLFGKQQLSAKKKLSPSVTGHWSVWRKILRNRKERFCRAYTWDGSLLGILHFDSEKKLWQPEKVFN
jgi:hypothetical protein